MFDNIKAMIMICPFAHRTKDLYLKMHLECNFPNCDECIHRKPHPYHSACSSDPCCVEYQEEQFFDKGDFEI